MAERFWRFEGLGPALVSEAERFKSMIGSEELAGEDERLEWCPSEEARDRVVRVADEGSWVVHAEASTAFADTIGSDCTCGLG